MLDVIKEIIVVIKNTIKGIPRNVQCPHCGNIYQMDIDQRRYIGELVLCRCREKFVATPIDVPKDKRRNIKRFNLLSITEIEEELERVSLPGGIAYSEFIDVLCEPNVVPEVIAAIENKYGKEIGAEEIRAFIEGIKMILKDEYI